jgi:predicted HAD superfamily Cof-like phosphohydrolase
MRPRASHPTRRSAVQTPSSERPVPPKLPRARAAALIESVADAAAAASVTPDRAISGAHAEQRAGCAAQASESVSSSVDREWCRSSCGGERHTHRGDQRCKTPSSKRPVPPKLPKARAAALIESVADVAAAASVTPDRAISGANAEQQAACAAQASEGESSSVDRERCRRNCVGERHARQGNQQKDT